MPGASNKPVVFLAFANDRDDTVGYLRNLPEEARQIRGPLLRAQRDGLCEVVELANATADDIFRVFQDSDYRDRIAVFHYGGHANGYQLLLESASGSPHAADAGGLAAFFGHQRGLDLVFLNGCSTQQQVQGLLDADVSAVIATSRAIEDQVAMQFSKQFYQGLAGGANLRTAYDEAAAAVQTSKGGNTRALYFGDSDQDALSDTGTDRWPWELYLGEGAEEVASWSLPKAVGDPLFSLPKLAPGDLPDSPFCHLSWFDREHAEVFFGRGHQIRELYDLVTSPTTPPIVLFYGQSGVGKSSMLAAGLIPRLEQTCEVRYLHRDQEAGLLGTLRGTFFDSGTSVSTTGSVHFSNDWQELERELKKPLVIILDQVEEVITRPNPRLPHEREDFLNELDVIFGKPQWRPAGRLILGFRKEWLAEVEARLAERRLPRAKVFLERLGRLGVIEAVQGPARSRRLHDQYGLTVEEGLAEIIADDLLEDASSAIAPTLQILLTKMWAKATEENYEKPHFSLKLYRGLKREGLLLRDFLDQQIERFRVPYPEVVDSGLLLDLLAVHTTPLGTADQHSIEELEPAYTGPGRELSELLQQCQDLYLLSTSADSRRESSPTTRLSHDTLAPLVRERFDEADLPGQRARRVLLSRVPDWKDGQEGQPLDEADLAIVEAGQSGMRRWTDEEQRLVAASRKFRARRKGRRRLLRLAGIAAIVMIALAGAVAIWQARIARYNMVTAHFMVGGADSQEGQPAEALYWFWRAYDDAEPYSRRKLNARNLIASWSRSLGAQLRHDDTVIAVAFSPDGQRVVTGSYDHTARIWDKQGNALTDQPLKHDGVVRDVAFSPDGKLLLTVSDDRIARLWDAVSGKPLPQSFPHDAAVTAIAFSPDGQTILTGCDDASVHRWKLSAPSGQPEKKRLRLKTEEESLKPLAFSPDGQTMLTVSGNAARLWDTETGEPLCDPLPHERTVNDAAFSANGERVVTGSDDKTARMWDITGSPIGEPFRFTESIVSVAFSPDGKIVLTGSGDNTARLWSTETEPPSIIGEPLRHDGTVAAVAFSPDGERIVTASWDNTARLWVVSDPEQWDAKSGAARGKPLPHDGHVTSTAFSPNGGFVLTGSGDSKARLWSTSTRELNGTLSHDGIVNAVAISLDGEMLLTGSQDKTARLWNAVTRLPQAQPMQHDGGVRAVAFSSDGKKAITGSDDRTARLWDTASGELRGKHLAHELPVTSVAFSPAGNLVLTGSDDKTARLWDAVTGEPHGITLQHSDSVHCVAFSPNGLTVATGSEDNSARLWDVETCLQRGGDMQHNEPVNAVIFSPDGRFVMTSSDDNTARLWDAATAEPIGELMRHGGPVTAAAVSPDSQTVATVSDDKTGRLWDAVTGQPRGESLPHAKKVTAVAFGPKGQTVITGSDDKTARLWNVPPSAKDDPERLRLSVEVRTGYYTDSRGLRGTLNQQQWLERKRKLDKMGGPCGIVSWADLTGGEPKTSGGTLTP